MDAGTIDVGLGTDHVKELTKLKKPIIAIEELIWNGLDADATKVEVILRRNGLDGLDTIEVLDDGEGIDASQKNDTFGWLGESPKRTKTMTPSGRAVHGRKGEGRFRALGLGATVQWDTCCVGPDGKPLEWGMSANIAAIKKFKYGAIKCARGGKRGTSVTVTNLYDTLGSLLTPNAPIELTQRLALYLQRYTGISVTYDGQRLNPDVLKSDERLYDLVGTMPDGSTATAKLTVIEWRREQERRLYLCTSEGFPRAEQPALSR